MKSHKIFIPILILIISSISFIGCEKTNDLNLDSALFGRWEFVDANGDINAWTFKDDGNCIQTAYNIDYNWKWEIEDSKLKLFVEGGTPTYKKYKIEEEKLYFWVDEYEIWSLPFIKK